MQVNERLQADLGYVRDVVRESESSIVPPATYILWAVIVLIGFTMADFATEMVGTFWLVAVPIGMIGSMVLGIRNSRRIGQIHRRLDIRYALHWFGIAAAMLLASMMVPLGMLSGRELGSVALLLTALAYYLAGVHFDTRLMWIGALTGAGYVAVLLVSTYAWTIVGVLVAGGLTTIALSGGSRIDSATE